MLAVLCSCFPLTSSCCCFFWEDGSKKKEKKNLQTLYMCVGTLLEGKYAILAAEFLQLSVGLRLLADKPLLRGALILLRLLVSSRCSCETG